MGKPFNLRLKPTDKSRCNVLKEPQTVSIYWFYLLCNHVVTLTKSKLFVTSTFVYTQTTIYF